MTVVNKFGQSWMQWCQDVPYEYRDADLDGVNHDTAVACLEWAAGLFDSPYAMDGPTTCGQNLVITGPPGAGKTWAAFATCKHLKWVGHPRPNRVAELGADPDNPLGIRQCSFRYWSAGTLLAQLRADELRTWSFLRTSSVLFLDDIGSMRSTEWVLDQLYLVLDFFRSNNKPVISTTNLQMPDLEKYLGAAAYSRLMSGAVGIELLDNDRRKKP